MCITRGDGCCRLDLGGEEVSILVDACALVVIPLGSRLV